MSTAFSHILNRRIKHKDFFLGYIAWMGEKRDGERRWKLLLRTEVDLRTARTTKRKIKRYKNIFSKKKCQARREAEQEKIKVGVAWRNLININR